MEGIISSIAVAVITLLVGWILKSYLNRAITQNKDQYNELLKDYKESMIRDQAETFEVLKDINLNVKNLICEITSLKIELVEKYVTKMELDKFKKDNIDAHKELRGEIRDLEKRSA